MKLNANLREKLILGIQAGLGVIVIALSVRNSAKVQTAQMKKLAKKDAKQLAKLRKNEYALKAKLMKLKYRTRLRRAKMSGSRK